MGYPDDDTFAEAHGWNKDRPSLSEVLASGKAEELAPGMAVGPVKPRVKTRPANPPRTATLVANFDKVVARYGAAESAPEARQDLALDPAKVWLLVQANHDVMFYAVFTHAHELESYAASEVAEGWSNEAVINLETMRKHRFETVTTVRVSLESEGL